MKKFSLALFWSVAAAGCTNLNDGKSLTDEVTSQPSPAFMKKVASDPFPAAGTQFKASAQPAQGATAPSTRVGEGNSVTRQSGTVQFGPTQTSGTANKKAAGS